MPVNWSVVSTVPFESWFAAQGQSARVAILAHLKALEAEGPHLGRPYCDTLKGSKVANLKGLRVQVGGEPYRVLFAFDVERSAVLLVGGNKTGDKRWYEIHIPIAERIFTTWEAQIRKRRLAAQAAAKRLDRS